MNGQPKRRVRNRGWRGMTWVVGSTLVVLNLIAWRQDQQASRELDIMSAANAELDRVQALRNDCNRARDILTLQIASFRQGEMSAALRGAIESTPLKNMLLCKTAESNYNDESYYLCPPDDLQLLVIKIKLTDKPIPMSPVNDLELTEEIEVPLTARKMHQLSIGFPRDSLGRFRVAFDDRELYAAGWEGFRIGSSFSGHTGGHSGLIQPATLQSQARDYSKQLSDGDWRLLCSKSFTLSRGKERRQIRFTVGLRTSGQMYASEEIYWSARRSLNLEWDSKLNRYRVLGPR